MLTPKTPGNRADFKEALTKLNKDQLERLAQVNEDNYEWIKIRSCAAGHAFELVGPKSFRELGPDECQVALELSHSSYGLEPSLIRDLTLDELAHRHQRVRSNRVTT